MANLTITKPLGQTVKNVIVNNSNDNMDGSNLTIGNVPSIGMMIPIIIS
ncbi:MAG: hypothetical protein OEL84_03755 [Nitrosopumilus sp.]|nr:hypothetical protein [Nitrosopumilus sp.]